MTGLMGALVPLLSKMRYEEQIEMFDLPLTHVHVLGVDTLLWGPAVKIKQTNDISLVSAERKGMCS